MCKENNAPRNREDSKPFASFDAEKEIGTVLNIEIATIVDVPGIEVQVPSLSSPGYSVWILIRGGHGKFVNENHRHNSNIVNCSSSLRAKEDNLNDVCLESSKPAVVNHGQGSQDSNNVKTKVEPSSMHRETVASSIWVAAASSESSSGGSSNPTSIHLKTKSIFVKKEIPKEDRIWTIIPGCPKCKRDSLEIRISKCVTEMVRHHDQDERETDGARHWDGVLSVLKGKFRNQMEKEFTDEDWLHCLYLRSIKTRFEICEDENGEIRYIRAIQGHSGGMIISPRLMNYVMIPYEWKRFIYHVGRARDENSSAEIGLVAGATERKEGRQTIFFTPLDPFNSDADEAESITDTTKLRKGTVSNSLEIWTRCSVLDSFVHSTRCWSRILANGFQCHYYLPVCAKECVVKVVSESGKRELFARQQTPRERPKVTLRPSWVHTRSNTVSMLRETESNLQARNSDPNASGSRTWPKEEIEQSIDLRVDGIPNDETYTDEQYIKKNRRTSPKTCDSERSIKRRLTSGQHSQ